MSSVGDTEETNPGRSPNITVTPARKPAPLTVTRSPLKADADMGPTPLTIKGVGAAGESRPHAALTMITRHTEMTSGRGMLPETLCRPASDRALGDLSAS